MSPLTRRLTILLIGFFAVASYAQQIPLDLESLNKNPLTQGDETKISNLTSSVSQWLGPLAPIAISPFFGITLLAGASQFGAEYLPVNSFISNNPVLSNPYVFWVFLTLTILTSLPRLTKVSKPAAQAIDQLEAYAGIITVVLIRVLSTFPESDPVGANTAMVVQMGVLTFSADILMSIAAAINIIVINTVKFFFEMMIWLVPVPFIDAILEIANKSLCAGLMAIYVWSPTVATIINLAMFVVSLLAFRWINRRVRYLRSVLCDPIWAKFNQPYGVPKRPELVVFPQNGVGPFPAKTKLLLQTTDAGWQLVQPRFILAPRLMMLDRTQYQLEMQTGMLLNSISVTGEESDKLLFSKRYAAQIDELTRLIKIDRSNEELDVDLAGGLSKA